MIHKLLHDPDKFERIFAAQYLYKYDFSATKSVLISLLEDEDKELVNFITKILEEHRGSQEDPEIK